MSAEMMFRPTAHQEAAEAGLMRAARYYMDYLREHPSWREHDHDCPGGVECRDERRERAAWLVAAGEVYERSLQ